MKIGCKRTKQGVKTFLYGEDNSKELSETQTMIPVELNLVMYGNNCTLAIVPTPLTYFHFYSNTIDHSPIR